MSTDGQHSTIVLLVYYWSTTGANDDTNLSNFCQFTMAGTEVALDVTVISQRAKKEEGRVWFRQECMLYLHKGHRVPSCTALAA